MEYWGRTSPKVLHGHHNVDISHCYIGRGKLGPLSCIRVCYLISTLENINKLFGLIEIDWNGLKGKLRVHILNKTKIIFTLRITLELSLPSHIGQK